MRIGGLHPFSLSDFPGRVAPVVFAQGCDFRCPYCHNASLLCCNAPDDYLLREEALVEFVRSRRGRFDGVVVSGGEPCLQPDLSTFLRRIKNEGLAVKLDTNGSRPEVLTQLFSNGLVDYVAMDVKAPLRMYDRLCGVHVPIHNIQESIALIAQSGVDHEFRTTLVKPLLSPVDVVRIRKLVPPGSRHRFQKFRPEHALDPALRTPRRVQAEGLRT